MGGTNSCLGKKKRRAQVSLPAPATETSSRCVMPTATGAHNFTITNYSLLSGMGVDKFVSSSTFSVGGSDWNVQFYPDGDSRGPGYAGAFLFLRRAGAGATGVKAKFTLSLLGADGKVCGDCKPVSLAKNFEPAAGRCSWGVVGFVEKSKLRDDCFTIRCDLTVIKDAVVETM